MADRSDHRKQARALVRKAKDVPCADCGERYPPIVMDLDHVRGEKVRNVARMVRDRHSLKSIEAEIEKCEVVCANCHRLRSAANNVYGGDLL